MENYLTRLLSNKLALSGWSFGFFCFFTIIYILFFPDKAKKLASWIYLALAYFIRAFRKRYIAADIESRVNQIVKDIDKEVPDIAPYKLKIKWVTSSTQIDKESFLRGDNAILVMNYYKNQNRNFVNATTLFCQEALIPEAKNYLDTDLITSIDLTMSKKIIQQQKREALNHFVKDNLKPQLQKHEKIEKYCNILLDLDEAGFFTRIFLYQLKEMGVKLYPRKIADPELIKETNNFTLFLKDVATKKLGEDVKLLFDDGRYVKIGIILVAKDKTLILHDIDPYVERIGSDIDAGSDIIYVIGYGRNIDAVQKIADEAKTVFDQITILNQTAKPYKGQFIGEKIKLVCIPLLVEN